MTREKAQEIVGRLQSDLCGRSGLGFDGLDRETRNELSATWVSIVLDVTHSPIEEDVTKRAEQQAAALVTVAGDGTPGGAGLLIDDYALWLQTTTASRVSHQATQVRAILARAIATAVQEDRARSAVLQPLAAAVVDAAIAWVRDCDAGSDEETFIHGRRVLDAHGSAADLITTAVHAYERERAR